jgi:hypothetical protein
MKKTRGVIQKKKALLCALCQLSVLTVGNAEARGRHSSMLTGHTAYIVQIYAQGMSPFLYLAID